MAAPPPGSREITLLLPLGVVAHQLVKLEGQLRSISIRSTGGSEPVEEPAIGAPVAATLERIHELLASLQSLVNEIEAGWEAAVRRDSIRRSED
jgi:hypothetical protein